MPADVEALQLANEFIAAINARDVKRLARLMTKDHTFVDATGAVHAGRETMTVSWKTYFEKFPKYTIEVETALAKNGVVAAFGWVSGSAPADARTGRSRSGLTTRDRSLSPAGAAAKALRLITPRSNTTGTGAGSGRANTTARSTRPTARPRSRSTNRAMSM